MNNQDDQYWTPQHDIDYSYLYTRSPYALTPQTEDDDPFVYLKQHAPCNSSTPSLRLLNLFTTDDIAAFLKNPNNLEQEDLASLPPCVSRIVCEASEEAVLNSDSQDEREDDAQSRQGTKRIPHSLANYAPEAPTSDTHDHNAIQKLRFIQAILRFKTGGDWTMLIDVLNSGDILEVAETCLGTNGSNVSGDHVHMRANDTLSHSIDTVTIDHVLQQHQQLVNASLHHYLQAYSPPPTALGITSTSGWAFAQGLILGQLSVIVLVLGCFKWLFMEGTRDSARTIKQRNKDRQLHVLKSAPNLSPNATTILSKTFYDLHTHRHESTDWLNVLIAQVLSQYRDDAFWNGRLVRALDEVVNGTVRPDFVGPINIRELTLGDEFPIFSNARIRPSDELGQMRAEIDFDFSDQLKLGIETSLVVNWPRPAVASLPIALGVEIITLEFMTGPPATPNQHAVNDDTEPPSLPPPSRYIAISTLPDFALQFRVTSLIGSKTKLENLPKVSELVVARLKNVYVDRLVWPNYVKVRVPDVWVHQEASKTTAGDAEASDQAKEQVPGTMKAEVKERVEEFVNEVKEA